MTGRRRSEMVLKNSKWKCILKGIGNDDPFLVFLFPIMPEKSAVAISPH